MGKYVNVYGLIYVAVIMIPNIIFVMSCKDGFENKYHNPVVEIMEQIGRFGSFICMIVILPWFYKGFWFENGKLIYIVCGFLLVILYCGGWLVFWRESSVRKSLFLSVVPSLLFLESGIVTGYLPLILFAVIFAPCHVLISYRNAV